MEPLWTGHRAGGERRNEEAEADAERNDERPRLIRASLLHLPYLESNNNPRPRAHIDNLHPHLPVDHDHTSTSICPFLWPCWKKWRVSVVVDAACPLPCLPNKLAHFFPPNDLGQTQFDGATLMNGSIYHHRLDLQEKTCPPFSPLHKRFSSSWTLGGLADLQDQTRLFYWQGITKGLEFLP